MVGSVDVAVIGAGQAGLATSWAVFDEMGFPIQTDGRSSMPGLYCMGVPWMRKFKSSILYGVAEDAQVVTRQIVESRQ
ncbi:MAG: hypothetical protein ACREOM_03090 [Candidatus Dormibacteraceae bacterium]